MTKILYSDEILEMLHVGLTTTYLDPERRSQFLEAVGEAIANAFGGELSSIGEARTHDLSEPTTESQVQHTPDDDQGHSFSFRWNTETPESGGIWNWYDLDMTIEDWKKEAEIKGTAI
ncbi:hypothetical protein [Leptolyngbya sp. AN10]|uniref:hypothetical protein n=1 Tax=Leptolyngbya sp. AN10 TaxID=3423365 RepID=UPI003D31A028